MGNGNNNYNIDDILEEARRRQKQQKTELMREKELAQARRERTQTDIDRLLEAYGPLNPQKESAHEEDELIIPEEMPKTDESLPQAAAQAKAKRYNAFAMSVTGTQFETISVQKDIENALPKKSAAADRKTVKAVEMQTDFTEYINRAKSQAKPEPAPNVKPKPRKPMFAPKPVQEETEEITENDYISPFTGAEDEQPEPVQTGFTEYIKRAPKPQPEEETEKQPMPTAQILGDGAFYLGDDDFEEAPDKLFADEEAPVAENEDEEEKPRFILPKKAISTGEEPVNLTVRQDAEADDEEEKFIKTEGETVKTEADVQINTPEKAPQPAKRFIHPPTMKTGQLPVINTPDDYILGDGEKYIKVPEDYVDPFAEKTFTFTPEEKTSEELPADGNTIVAGAGAAHAEEAQKPADEELEGQIRIDGFAEEESVQTIDEEEAEQMVFESRKEKINSFRLHEDAKSKISDNSEKPAAQMNEAVIEEIEDFEYRSPNDAARVREELNARRAYQALKILGLGLIGFFLLWLGLFSQFGKGIPSGLSPESNPVSYLVTNLLLTVAAAAICKSAVSDGIKSAVQRRFGSHSVLAASLAAVVLHNLVLTGFTDAVASGACHVYNSIAVLSLLCAEVGEFIRLTHVAYNFRFLRSKGEKQAMCAVENEQDAEALSHGAVVGDTNLCYSVPVDFPAGFLTLSKRPGQWEKKSAKYMPWFYAAAGVVFLLSWILQKSFAQALSGFTALCCVFAPLTLLLTEILPLRSAGKILNANGAMLAGLDSAAQFADINGVVLDASDLFPTGATQLYGLKSFHGMRVDDAILYAAGMLRVGGAPLSKAFDQVIEQRREMLPDVESLTYEDGMGLSGWIYDSRVLLGNREMMLHHGVEMPSTDVEKKHLQGDPDRRAVYMAVGGRLAAMFVVGYAGSEKIAAMLCALEENGVCLLLRTTDPNVDEAMISRYFDISKSSVKILSSVGGLLYTEKLRARREKAPASVIHNGTLRGFLGAVVTCIGLKEKLNFSMLLQTIGILLGTLLVAFFSMFAGLSQIGVFQLFIYELFWGLVVTLSGSLRLR